jgi:hypothetical protein
MPQGKGTYGSKVGRPRKYQAGAEAKERQDYRQRVAESRDAHEQAQMQQLQDAQPRPEGAGGRMGPAVGRMEGAPPQAPGPDHYMKEMGSKAGIGAAGAIPGAGAAEMARKAAGVQHSPAEMGKPADDPFTSAPKDYDEAPPTTRGRGGILAKGGAIKSSNMLRSGGSTGGNGIL